MPTRLAQNFDTKQGALTVFVEDAAEEEHKLETYIRDLYDPEEYLYIDNSGISGRELYSRIYKEGVEDCNVRFPGPDRRLIFVYYLCLNDLTEQWTEKFFERAHMLYDIARETEQQHVLAFYYEVERPLKQSPEEVMSLLHNLGYTSQDVIERKVLLLWKSGFASLDTQECGLVQLIHILSRRNKMKGGMMASNSVGILCYGDYYADRADACEREIARCMNWINNAEDPDFSELAQAVRNCTERVFVLLESAESDFRNRIGLYPVSIRDYKKGLLGYKLMINDNDPRILSRMEDYIKETRAKRIREVELSEIETCLRDKMNFPDLQAAADLTTNGNLAEWISAKCYGGTKKPEDPVIQGVAARLEDLLAKAVGDREARKAQAQEDMRRYRKERERIGSYKSLSDFADNVLDRLLPEHIRGITPALQSTYVMVCGEGKTSIEMGTLQISGAPEAYFYPEIAPCEIAVLRECEFIALGDTEREMRIANQIFGKG